MGNVEHLTVLISCLLVLVVWNAKTPIAQNFWKAHHFRDIQDFAWKLLPLTVHRANRKWACPTHSHTTGSGPSVGNTLSYDRGTWYPWPITFSFHFLFIYFFSNLHFQAGHAAILWTHSIWLSIFSGNVFSSCYSTFFCHFRHLTPST